MTGTHTQNPLYSRITMALMEDTGWYLPNYDLADELSWGKDLGCNFALKWVWVSSSLLQMSQLLSHVSSALPIFFCLALFFFLFLGQSFVIFGSPLRTKLVQFWVVRSPFTNSLMLPMVVLAAGLWIGSVLVFHLRSCLDWMERRRALGMSIHPFCNKVRWRRGGKLDNNTWFPTWFIFHQIAHTVS